MEELIVPRFKMLVDDPQGKKYELLEEFGPCFVESIKNFNLDSEFAHIQNGFVKVKPGFRWDGNSGPAVDTTSVFVAGMVHDMLYRAIEERIFQNDKYSRRKAADAAYLELIKRYGGNWFRRSYHWLGVRIGGWLHV
jgi:hypothetical protein